MKSKLLITFCCSLVYFAAFANDLSITQLLPSTQLEVCQTGVFGFVVENTGTDTTKNISLQIQLTTGLTYLAGSVTGANAAPLNLSNLNQPIFSLPNLLVGQKDTFWITAQADCGLVSAINSGTVFTNTVIATYTGGTKTLTSSPFAIETPLLIISNVTPIWAPNYLWGDQFTRTITIKNTRIGALTEFFFVDVHNGLLDIQTAIGTPILSNPNEFRLLLSGADFATIGDGDTLFELNETLIITEQLIVRSCGGVLQSDIKVNRGCNNAICQEAVSVAAIGVGVSPYAANLAFYPTSNFDACYCGNTAIPQQMIIKNNGDDEALFPIFKIQAIAGLNAIDPTSITMTFNGNSTNISPVYWENDTMPCFASADYKTKLDLALPNILPGDSLIIDWSMYFCQDECSSAYAGWSYDYSYYDNCPAGTFITSSTNHVGVKSIVNTITPNSVNLQDSIPSTFTYQLTDSEGILQSPAGFLRLNLTLPCSVVWDNDANDFMFGAQAPFSSVYDTAAKTIALDFALPIAQNNPSLSFDLTQYCHIWCEDDSSDFVIDVSTNIYLDANCDTSACNGIQVCPEFGWALITDCAPPSVPVVAGCEDTLVGGNLLAYNIARVNFGAADNDNNGTPDASGSLNPTLVRSDRAMVGDTIRETVRLEILDEFSKGYAFAYWESAWFCPSDAAFHQEKYFTHQNNTFEIHDTSTNAVYTCSNLDYTVTSTSDSLIYRYRLDAAYLASKGCVPPNFKFQKSDSLVIKTTYVLKYNVANTQNNFNHIARPLLVRGNLYLSDPSYLPNYYKYDCFAAQGMQISGYKISVGIGQSVVRPCVLSDFSGLNSVYFYLATNNFFPYEYRSFAEVLDLSITPDPQFQLDSARIVSAGIPPGLILIPDTNFETNFIGADSSIHFDLSPLQDTVYDESFYYFLQNKYTADCDLTGFYNLKTAVQFQLSKEMNDSIFTETRLNGSALRMLRPNLAVTNNYLPNIVATTAAVSWDFELKNNVTTSGGLESQEAFNAWVRPVSPDGTLTNFTLINTATNQPYAANNGIYQLGNLQKNELKNLRVTATNNGCATETLRIYFGWNCSLYTNPSDTACFIDSVDLTVVSIVTELEMTLSSPIASTFALCSTIPKHTTTVFNADIGSATALKLEVVMPQGLSIVSNSSQLSFPNGSIFINIPNPVNIVGNIWQWDVSSLNAILAANGLKGINDYPNNTFKLQFNTIADCDYISGSFIVFRAKGDNLCGEPTNTVTRTSPRIFISGAIPAYTSNITMTMDTVGGCADQLQTRLDINLSGSSGGTDSVFINLPPGIAYATGSYAAIANATNNPPFVSVSNGITTLKWKINSGLTGGTTVSFSFQTKNYRNFTCGEELLMFAQTVSPANALCVTTGVICNILVSTGVGQHKIRINRAKLVLSNFTMTATPLNGQEFIRRALTIQNTGAAMGSNNPVVVQYYYDVDGDGVITAADNLLHTESLNLGLPAGGSWNLSINNGGFYAPVGSYCRIIAIIDTANNCICSGSQIRSFAPVAYAVPTQAVCPNTDILIGQTAQAGAQYLWQSAGVSCGNCAMTTVNIANNTTNVINKNFIQEVIAADGCKTNFTYLLATNPKLSSSMDSVAVCMGDSIHLTTQTATAYSWAGENLNNPFAQNPSALPSVSQWYQLQMTDNLGCMYADSIWARVRTVPSALGGDDQSICSTLPFTQLHAVYNSTYAYQWSPIGTLNNPFVFNPIVFPTQTTNYQLKVTDGYGCTATDWVTVFVAQAPAPTSEQISLCEGEVFIYENDTIAAAGDYNYLLQAFNGCDSVHTVSVNFRDTAFTNVALSICQGDSVILGNQILKQDGTFCHVFSTFNGCDSTVCVQLTVRNDIFTVADTALCPDEVLVWNDSIYTVSGIYEQRFSGANGCDSIHQITLDFYPEMVLNYEDNLSIPIGTTYDYTISGGNTYLWNPADYLSCSDCANPQIEPLGDVNYEILVTDENGCQQTITLEVQTVNTCFDNKMGIPNMFTPNNDGTNDDFGVIAPYGVQTFSMQIFNRWGEKIFETAEPFERWSGWYNGKLQTQDSYVYVITGNCIGGDSFYFTGSVLLVW